MRLLLATSDLASQPSPELRAFLRGSTRPTSGTQTFAADLAEARFDRLALRVTDTPGLDVRPGRELVLERQLGALISGLEQRFKDTMEEESIFTVIDCFSEMICRDYEHQPRRGLSRCRLNRIQRQRRDRWK